MVTIPPLIAQGIAQWRERMSACRDERCPRCDDAAAPDARACLCRGVNEPDALVCRWHEVAAAEERERELTEVRAQRLAGSGCAHPRALADVPARRGIVAPPREWVPPADRAPIRASLDAARRFLADRSVLLLVVSGGYGTGKSYLAAQVVAASPCASLWLQAPSVGRFGEWYDRDDRPGLETRSLRVPLLVVDDLGTETAKAQPLAATLLEERINHGRRTVVTTNLAPDALLERLGGRVQSRFAECGASADMGQVDLRARVRAA